MNLEANHKKISAILATTISILIMYPFLQETANGPVSTSAAVHLVKLRPGGTAQVIGPSVGTTYQAVASEMTTASVTFHYQSSNGGTASITKSFKFNII